MSEFAFPRTRYHSDEHPIGYETGMTLRDYFAAKAMAIVMTPLLVEIQKRSVSDADALKLKHVASDACYGIADAMMKARKL
jgi:hypothetical protein